MIKVTDLHKRFDGSDALRGLNMNVPKGAVYGLVGPNGAGKTTAIRHITGLLRPDSGSVTVFGQPVFENPAVKRRLAFIPDEISYFPASNLEELSKLYAGVYPRFDLTVFSRLRSTFDLSWKTQLRRFSRGMQKQAAFCLSIAARPDLLVLDEPVDGLDPVARRQIWSILLQDVAERELTVLVSSHNLRELEDACDHVGILHKGRLLLERNLSELQGDVVKAQLVLREGTQLPQELQILHRSMVGQVETLILRGDTEQLRAVLSALDPVFFDLVPLTLEEIFIYELGGENYEVKHIFG